MKTHKIVKKPLTIEVGGHTVTLRKPTIEESGKVDKEIKASKDDSEAMFKVLGEYFVKMGMKSEVFLALDLDELEQIQDLLHPKKK